MNRIELKTKIELFRRELKLLESIKVGCLSCEHGTRKGWCDKFEAAPPSDVIDVGCDEYVYDEIPF